MGLESELIALSRRISDLEQALSRHDIEIPRVRKRILANLTLYVRADGADSNNGLTNTAAGAFLTIQKAIDVCCQDYDCGPYGITIQVANGIWDAATLVLRDHPHNTWPTLRGDPTTPSNVIIRGNVSPVLLGSGAWNANGIQLQRISAGDVIGYAGYGNRSLLNASNVHFGAVGANGYHYLLEEGAKVYIRTAYTVTTGGLGFYAHARIGWSGSALWGIDCAVNFVGAGAIAGGFVIAHHQAAIYMSGSTFTGNASSLTGTRYVADTLAHIEVGGSPTFFPGTVAGAPTGSAIYT